MLWPTTLFSPQVAFILLIVLPSLSSFSFGPINPHLKNALATTARPRRNNLPFTQLSASNSPLPSVLEKLVSGLESTSDEKLRYKQLLHLASTASPFPKELKIPANKVPGCLSVVYVHAEFEPSTSTINYLGESDSILTKGLVTLLTKGMSGSTVEEIQNVQPDFIERSGIGASLTPGRNNGFLNMLNTMKLKAVAVTKKSSSTKNYDEDVSTPSGDSSDPNGRPISTAVKNKLELLKPETLIIKDESPAHAGHSGLTESDGKYSDESHFSITIVASVFDGVSSVNRHKLVYTILGDELMSKIHALQINTKTPSEYN